MFARRRIYDLYRGPSGHRGEFYLEFEPPAHHQLLYNVILAMHEVWIDEDSLLAVNDAGNHGSTGFEFCRL